MNDFEALRDYVIADEIQRIQSLPREELVRELIELSSREIEKMTDSQLLLKSKSYAQGHTS